MSANPRLGGGMGTGRRMKVLACDDEPFALRLIQVNLERLGYDVRVVRDGSECLEMVRNEMPDLLIVDVQMPVMDGFAVLKAVRQDPTTANLPVIMLTEKGSDDEMVDAYRQGADMYLTKPFDPGQATRVILGS